jgi:hypothetical protein
VLGREATDRIIDVEVKKAQTAGAEAKVIERLQALKSR